MGIHGNSTCVMNYDEATGYLIGAENKGLNAMFVMMNEARLGVGLQGLSVSEVAYQNAANYARERIQGRSLSGAKAPDKKADPIIVHPDVRRTLMTIRAFNEAGRAFTLVDGAEIRHRPSLARMMLTARPPTTFCGLMTPILKGVLTDKGFDHAVMAQQMYGGHGYIEEWGMSQYVRDARIAMIYEGANGVQALDLVGRKLALNGGRAIMALFKEIGDFCEENRADEKLVALYQGPEEGPERPAGRNHVVHAECHGKARQCRCRLDRLHASLRPRRSRLHVGARSPRPPSRSWPMAIRRAPTT